MAAYLKTKIQKAPTFLEVVHATLDQSRCLLKIDPLLIFIHA